MAKDSAIAGHGVPLVFGEHAALEKSDGNGTRAGGHFVQCYVCNSSVNIPAKVPTEENAAKISRRSPSEKLQYQNGFLLPAKTP
ncbi:hypothetical protein Q1695_007191 [Nippostrongylus brasiliensis]|nr:hypothetical protein Q1695_007191 [Nippostrongylus brasiliensis]